MSLEFVRKYDDPASGQPVALFIAWPEYSSLTVSVAPGVNDGQAYASFIFQYPPEVERVMRRVFAKIYQGSGVVVTSITVPGESGVVFDTFWTKEEILEFFPEFIGEVKDTYLHFSSGAIYNDEKLAADFLNLCHADGHFFLEVVEFQEAKHPEAGKTKIIQAQVIFGLKVPI